jgi:hypothetical protein
MNADAKIAPRTHKDVFIFGQLACGTVPTS